MGPPEHRHPGLPASQINSRGEIMEKVFERVYYAAPEIFLVPLALKALAENKAVEGYKVERGLAGSVILKLDDGEVHYVPRNNTIVEFGFKYQPVCS